MSVKCSQVSYNPAISSSLLSATFRPFGRGQIAGRCYQTGAGPPSQPKRRVTIHHNPIKTCQNMIRFLWSSKQPIALQCSPSLPTGNCTSLEVMATHMWGWYAMILVAVDEPCWYATCYTWKLYRPIIGYDIIGVSWRLNCNEPKVTAARKK